MHTLTIALLPFALLLAASWQDPKTPQDPKAKPATAPAAKSGKADFPVVKLETTEGTILLELNRVKAPGTVENFLNYVRKGFYDGLVFHRIKADFMIQGGGFNENLQKKEGDKTIKIESDNGLKNDAGTIAMARLGIPDPNTATSEFFINTVNNDFLNFKDKSATGWGYCVFGKVKDDASMKVVEAIKKIPVVANPMMGGEISKPTKLVKITKATIVSE